MLLDQRGGGPCNTSQSSPTYLYASDEFCSSLLLSEEQGDQLSPEIHTDIHTDIVSPVVFQILIFFSHWILNEIFFYMEEYLRE